MADPLGTRGRETRISAKLAQISADSPARREHFDGIERARGRCRTSPGPDEEESS